MNKKDSSNDKSLRSQGKSNSLLSEKSKIFDKKQYDYFLNHIVKSNTILIVEINGCHWETIPGFCKYLIELGYNVDVITRCYAEEIFTSLKYEDKLKTFECNEKTFDRIIKDYDFTKYDRIIYNSKIIYIGKVFKIGGYDLSEYYDVVPKGKKENIYVQHHIDKINDFYKAKQIILANPAKKPELEDLVVNPHYFGELKLKNYKKQDFVNFISIGELSQHRKNWLLLISAVRDLHNLGISNFNVTIIGKRHFNEIDEELEDPEIKKYFKILGRVDYQTMFKNLNKADFILPLLEPGMSYMEKSTSGTFQLIYGFNKPCIIHKIYADIYGFNKKNSLIYESNEDLSDVMQKAISMTNDEYKNIQKNLSSDVQIIEKHSLSNFQKILGE